MNPKTQSRRRFLRAAGVSLAIPLLESNGTLAAETAAPPKRMFAANIYFGLYAESFFPQAAGRSYELPPYLKAIKEYRDSFTVFSGLSHPDVGGGHDAAVSFLTAAPHPGTVKFRNSISFDQMLVEKLDPKTRYPYLALSTAPSGQGISFNRAGIRIPAESKPSALFAKLFLSSKDDAKQQMDRLAEGRSVMDTVLDQAKQLEGSVSGADKGRLEQYFTAVREVERRLADSQAWVLKPKPKVDALPPKDISNHGDVIGRTRLMLDLAHLAFQTDSTRIITLMIYGDASKPPIEAVSTDYHGLSHHGNDPEKLKQLHIVENLLMETLGGFLGKLRGTKEGTGTLLDSTMVLTGSNLGSASSHNTMNLPIMLAGGGFKHGQHLAFDRKANTPLAKLYVSMAQRLGCETGSFASGNGRIAGLEG